MIFQHTHEQVASGLKTVTRRLWTQGHGSDGWLSGNPGGFTTAYKVHHQDSPDSYKPPRVLWEVGKTYAVQPGRGKPAEFRIEVVSLRLERLNDITPAEVIAEGVRVKIRNGKYLVAFGPSPCAADYLPDGSFAQMNNGKGPSGGDLLLAEYFALWDTIHRTPGTRVKDNPEVVRIEFRKVNPCPKQ